MAATLKTCLPQDPRAMACALVVTKHAWLGSGRQHEKVEFLLAHFKHILKLD